MNEGDSAGGGHQGSNPAPPAVTDRRSTIASNTINQQQQQQQHQQSIFSQGQQSRTTVSGSAVLVSNNKSNVLTPQQSPSQQQQQQSMNTRYLPGSDQQQQRNSSSGSTFPNQQQTRVIIAQASSQNYPPQQSASSAGVTSVSLARTSSSANSYLSVTNAHVSSTSSDSSSQSSQLSQSQTFSDSSSENHLQARKRLRCDVTVAATTTTTATTAAAAAVVTTVVGGSNTKPPAHHISDLNALKKRILEYKFSRLRSIKEKYSEHVAELFFLQTGGNMMDYPTWRKKPPTPQFITFTKSFRLDGTFTTSTSSSSAAAANDDTNRNSASQQLKSITTTSTSSSSSSPQGAEIKIPSVGATPVAVSTTLPAAVVQLSQQGHIPGRPQGGRHGMVFGQIPAPPTIGNSSVPLVPGGTPILPDISTIIGTDKQSTSVTSANVHTQNPHSINGGGNGGNGSTAALGNNLSSTTATSAGNGNGNSGGNNPDQFSVKAKQEVYVMQRISELQREGLWTERRLPKLQEPPRPKAHWDYLLEEMVWLAADFAQERKWKKSAAKKCARMVQKYFQDKASAAQRAEKAQEIHLKRVAAFISKEVKMFWSNVEKLVEYKHHTKLEEKRKKALDQHLSFIVDQTEKFSQQLAEGMNKPTAMDTSAAPSINSSRISSPKHKSFSDDEFCPANEMSEDDEETIAKAEAEAGNVNDEVAALQRESAMELDDFLKELPKDYLQNRDKIVLDTNSDQSSSSGDDDEFQANESSSDDEDTIREQEGAEKDVDHKKELDELNAENEMSLEELLTKYKGAAVRQAKKTAAVASSRRRVEKMEVDSDDDADETEDLNDSDDDMSVDSDGATSDAESGITQSNDEEDADENDEGLKSLLVDEQDKNQSQEDKDNLINDAAAIAESIQPKGNTLSSTNVVTPVPFLLKHSLREYQHIGLDWLVTMNDRKLNGILADEMGLGKTIQTIALLAHLACVKANWGPHLIVVPSSVMLNWEMEFKKWCPGFKILTYYGTQKERKQKRIGWTKANAFHVCITSYKLVIQDQQSFRRKKWKYLILDEAQNIKNFKSQRWQLLLNFQTERRLLLTGTPLQNNLMELWSLMHFLMPHVFQSHREFKEWFSNPMTGMIEGNSEYNDSIIKRLHKVLRPFLLRRLKSEVEKQMPKKYEHVVMCRLSKRQRFLYDDFMSRAKTRETLAGGNLLSVINVLMQLRKVCNHPNMFEVRPTTSPFQMEGITFQTASLVCNMFNYDPFKEIDLNSLNLNLLQLEDTVTAYVSHRIKKIGAPRKLIEEIDTIPEAPPRCPAGKYKFHIRIRDTRVHGNLLSHSGVKVGTSPAMKTEGNKLVPVINVDKKPNLNQGSYNRLNYSLNNSSLIASSSSVASAVGTTVPIVTPMGSQIVTVTTTSTPQLIGGRVIVPSQNGQRQSSSSSSSGPGITRSASTKSSGSNASSSAASNQNLVATLAQQLKTNSLPTTGQNKDKKSGYSEGELDPDFYFAEREKLEKERRQNKLNLLARVNQRRCDSTPIYGADFRKSIQGPMAPSRSPEFSTWHSRSYTNCLQASRSNDNWSLSQLMKSYEQRAGEMISIVTNYVLFVPAVSSPPPYLQVGHLNPSRVNEDRTREQVAGRVLSQKLTLLHPVISAMKTQFPDPRLIQYDCGKLQTLDKLLRRLKTEGHRALIFTQMTKMLDVLEAFLNYHGHIYLRLDGTTRVEQRQILMERFNGDKRIFAFILSTRSGGVGVNLTGADTVIFYDSDWNPTMDAQAQDRCHRIGQTRDVHIYRLVSEKTIEENILKKANQKRLLGDLAIEGGNFTTAYFKSSTIQDLFHVENSEEDANVRLSEVLERDRERRQRLHENLQQPVASSSTAAGTDEKSALGAYESALAAAEDEQDVEAATTAKAEAAADLEEFDENIPLDEVGDKQPEMSKADMELENLVKQLSPIERYAMRFVEETGGAWTAEQLRAAEAEIEQQKREWEANRLAALQKEEELLKAEEQNDDSLTYSREDSKNQMWISNNTLEPMPIWCPPTPPQNDNDIYIDYSLSFLYDTDIMPESQLPPVYVKKEYKRSRSEAGLTGEGRRPPKIRKEDNYYAPRSLFDRPSPALAKLRRDLKIQRYRGVFKPNIQIPGLKQQFPLKPLTEPEGMAEWCIYEDIAILHVLQNLQGLPLASILLSPGHTANWDLVADIVNQYSRTYRSPKQCRYRYETVIVPREEGKLVESPKKQKKLKNQNKSPQLKSGVKSMRTSQLFISDNNSSFTKLAKLKFENIKAAYLKKAPPPKQIFGVQTQKNPKHVAVLTDFGVTNYDCPLNPIEIAHRKAEKLKEKQRTLNIPMVVQQQPPQEQQSQPVQQSVTVQQQQQPTTIVVQQSAAQVANAVQQQVAQIMQATPLQRQTPQGTQIAVHQPTTQIVKAIVTPSSGIVTNQVQHIGQQTTQHVQLQTAGNVVTPSSVSVVLSTPVSTLSSVQHQASQATQIVSLHQQAITSTPTVVSQPQTNATLVQTISTQSLPHVVSVSQLATVGSVLTTSANLQSNATVASLNASTLRAQRIVATPGQLQEVVLQQRSNSQSPTIVSMSSLGQGVTQPQLQATQLRLAQQVIAKGIAVGQLQQTGKLPNQPASIQLYRQQPLRQHLKVLQTSTGQGTGTTTVVQTAGGQLVNASGTIIQGGIVPTGQTVQVQGQKIATVSAANIGSGASGVVTSVATVQVAPVQGRTQFIKQISASGKQTLTRQVNDNEMLLVKRPIIGQHKTQVIPQSSIYAQANVQVQQPGTSGQQQIATLVKTSQGTVTAASVGMTLSQLKPGPIKVTMANQNQVRQLQLQQQQIAIAQQRNKAGKTQIAQVAGKAGVPTQLIVQNPKNLTNSVTVQQIQHVIRQPGTSLAGQLVLGKTSVGRVIPVSVASQSNARQTIQVVSAASAQALAGAGNIRAHVTNAGNIASTIKVAANATQVQTQQALLNALQQQSQQNQQRQNASPVRLQTSGASLVAVPVQQVQSTSTSAGTVDVVTLTQQPQQQQQQQQTPQQQVRTLVKKRLMSFRSDKEQPQQ